MYKEHVKTVEVDGKQYIFKTGKLAPRAEASILAQVGETVVFTAVSMSSKDSTLDYFPLSVEYIEKFYAGGIISSSRFLKREMRPSDSAVLKARQVDHSIRSLFPKGFKREVSVVITVLSYDGINDPEVLAVNSASMALMISSIPFFGPSSSVKIGVKGSELILNPAQSEEEELSGEFMVSVREDRILNVEGWGKEVPEETMKKLLDFAVTSSKPMLEVQKEFQKEVGKPKMEFPELPADEALINKVKSDYIEEIKQALYDNENRRELLNVLKDKIIASDETLTSTDVDKAVEYVTRYQMRKDVLTEDKRSSGRKMDEIRELEIEVDVLPRVHGSALFRRGKTQCLSVLTLGSTRLSQTLESFEGEAEKPFMLHYNAPNFSIGEAGRFSYYPGRREIGHGNIGENALKNIVPQTDTFPYTVRVVSEVLSQNGSSSMAATCGACLALMDAGVPLPKIVGGIAVGLVTDDDDLSKYKLLMDMEDVEDFYGDMDFKVTGTEDGVTAVQLDNKLMGVPVEILKSAFDFSKTGRMTIIKAMREVLPAPRASLKPNAPKVLIMRITPSKIGELIGPGGKNIKSILEKAGEGVDIDIQDDGQINITYIDEAKRQIAQELIEQVTIEPEIGKIYKAKVDKVQPYGAFVNVNANISGLVHISNMRKGYVKDPSEIVKEGDIVNVKLITIENGKQGFSMIGLNGDETADESEQKQKK